MLRWFSRDLSFGDIEKYEREEIIILLYFYYYRGGGGGRVNTKNRCVLEMCYLQMIRFALCPLAIDHVNGSLMSW